eukprot:7187321-Pyramimonas_sp.AAC.1
MFGHSCLVQERSVQVASALSATCSASGLVISGKSTIVSNPPQLGERVAEAHRAKGIKLQTSQRVKDLGVDGSSTRRSADTMKKRLSAAR